MKKIYFFLICLFLSCALYAERQKISVIQNIRYPDGEFAELMTPTISKTKALKNNGNIILRYTFHVNDSYAYSNKASCSIIFPKNYRVSVTGMDGLKAIRNNDLDEYIIENGKIAPLYSWDDDSNAFLLALSTNKNTYATVEILLNVLNSQTGSFPINIEFNEYVESASEEVFSFGKSFLRGLLIVPFIKDGLKGDLKENPFESSNRKFTVIVSE